jgi:4-hydroxyacetophenone monooxygenase
MIETGHSRVQVTHAAHDRYNEALDEVGAGLLMVQDAGSVEKNYYVNEFGRVQMNAPWQSPHFYEMCTAPDWDDLELA